MSNPNTTSANTTMNDPKFIAMLVPKKAGEYPIRYLVKQYSSLGTTCEFRVADRSEALILSKNEAKRHVDIHNLFCSDSPLRGIIECV